MELTRGAVWMMANPEQQKKSASDFKPVLQVTEIESMFSSGDERYVLTLSDGTHTRQGMLASGKNYLISSQRLQKGSIVRVTQFVSTVILNRKVIMIIDLEPLLEKCDTIGNPKPLLLKCESSRSVKPEEKLAELTKKHASLQRAYEVEKKAREAAEQKLSDEKEANRQLREVLEFIKSHGPAGVFTESWNLPKPEVVPEEPKVVPEEPKVVPEEPKVVLEEPQRKKRKIKFMEIDQNHQSLAVSVRQHCVHCEVTKTPQWRAGPSGPSTLCNACGLRFKKTGQL